MCYAASLRKEEKTIEERFDSKMEIPLVYQPYYYLSGFKGNGNVYIITQEDTEIIYPAMWGLIPKHEMHHIEAFRRNANTLNAKSEGVFNKRSYRDSILTKRCLVLADGFFEPHKHMGVSYPHFCHLKNDSLFAFAGIYTKIDDELFTCSILTTKANNFFAKIHNGKLRMPLVLDKEFERQWLRNDLNKEGIKELIKVGFTTAEFDAYPVTKKLNQPKMDKNNINAILPVQYPELNLKQGNLFE